MRSCCCDTTDENNHKKEEKTHGMGSESLQRKVEMGIYNIEQYFK